MPASSTDPARRHHRGGAAPHAAGAEQPGTHTAADELTVTVDWVPRRPLVAVAGTLDAAGAALLSAVLEHVRARDGRAVIVDLSRVGHVSRPGLAPILDSGAEIRSASPRARRVLQLLGRPVRAGGGSPT